METTLKIRALALVAALLVTTTMLHLIANFALRAEQALASAGPDRMTKDAPPRRLCPPDDVRQTATIVRKESI